MTLSPTMEKKRAVAVVLLRLLASAACFSAVIVMATSHETATLFGITVEAKFQDTPAFKFLVATNAIISAYSLLVLFVPPASSLCTIIAILDLVAALLLTGSLGAAGAIAYVGKEGSARAGWFPVCQQVPKFCHQSAGSLVGNLVGAVLYMLIVLHGIHGSAVSPVM